MVSSLMFEIFGDSVETSICPSVANMRRLNRKSGQLRRMVILDAGSVGEEWSACAEELKAVGIVSLELRESEVRIEKLCWLECFSFIEELSIRAYRIAPDLQACRFKRLRSLGLDRGAKDFGDLSLYAELLGGLRLLYLRGRWSDCESLSNMMGIEELYLDKFRAPSYRWLSGLRVKTLCVAHGLDFDLAEVLKMVELEAIDFQCEVSLSKIPDLSEHPSLQTVSMMMTRKMFSEKEVLVHRFPKRVSFEFL